MTPSQAARRFADDNGFKIVAVGRRYQATHSSGVSFERGGYAALLNEMRAVIGCIENGNAHPVHGFAIDADTPVGGIPDECVASGASCSYAADGPNGEMQCRYCGKEKPVEMFDGEGVTWGTLEPITPDTVPMSREEMFAPVKAELARIARKARKLSGKPPGGPWHVIFNGRQLTKPGYPSRAEAIAVVRRGFNHPHLTIRNDWRTATVTVEYRA